MQPTVDPGRIEPLGVERGSPPFHHLPVVRMGRVPQSFQIVDVSGGTADIFRQAGPLPLQAHGVCHIHAGHDSLEDDVMFPTVAEVVLIPEHLSILVEKFSQAPPPFVSHVRGVVGIPKLTNGKSLKIKRK